MQHDPAPSMALSTSRRKSPLRRLLTWGGIGVTTSLAVGLGAFLISGCTAFGAKPEGERLARNQKSPEWNEGRFENPQPVWRDIRTALWELAFGPASPDKEPRTPVPVVHNDASAYAKLPASGLRVTWFGHSSALLEIDGTRVLIDPLWSSRSSPVAWAGPKHWYAPPTALNALPPVDVVVISHDHYDHLDMAVVLALRAKPTVFVVPLGVGAHLARWGIPDERIVELDWWQSTRVGALELVATPARHASGRSFSSSSNQTLWAGYAFIGARHRAWYSGDTGFHADFGRIGEQLGPFDVTLIESGQYDTNWPDSHLGPELAVEAHRQVRGKVMIPVHWALLSLAPHAWTEPVERVLAAARCHNVEVLVPHPGESVEPTQPSHIAAWWPQLGWHSARERPVVATRNGVASERVDMALCPGASASSAK